MCGERKDKGVVRRVAVRVLLEHSLAELDLVAELSALLVVDLEQAIDNN